MTKESVVYIYTLTDPLTNEIRYVGKTTNPKRRFKQHLNQAKEKNLYSKRWIQGLLEQGHEPIMTIIEKINREQWRERERHWIEYYRDQGAPLTNLSEGGQGCQGIHHTPEACEKIRRARQGMKFPEEHRTALRKSKNQFYNTPRGKEVIESLGRRYAALTDEEVIEVYLLAHQGISQKQIAKNYHIPPSSVSEIKFNKRYKYVKRPPLPLLDQE